MKHKSKTPKVDLFNPNNELQQDALQTIFRIASESEILLIAVTDDDFNDTLELYEEETDSLVRVKFTKQEVYDFRESVMEDMMNTYCEVVRSHFKDLLERKLAKK
jgi:DNA-binding ferritin-like protein (Dps family)